MTNDQLVSDVKNKVYFQVLTAEGDGEVQQLDFVKATLSYMNDVIVDNIRPMHNGRSFFEFVPYGRAEAPFKLQVYRTAESFQEFTVPSANLSLTT